jgi:hypothetical protein
MIQRFERWMSPIWATADPAPPVWFTVTVSQDGTSWATPTAPDDADSAAPEADSPSGPRP